MMKTAAAAVLLCAACSSEPGPASTPDLATPLKEEAVTLQFKAQVGAKALDCADSYAGVGTGKEHVHPGDLRLYVTDVRLVDAAGTERKLALTPDGTWQSAEVALLDLTDNSGECTGTAETNAAVKGTVRGDGSAWKGLRFTLGVPFAQNHQDVTKAAAPLNLSAMFWSWNGGYKFLLLEGKNHADKPFLFHLGSTGCMKDANNQITGCSAPNRPQIDLAGFDPKSQAVVVDVAQLLAKLNLDNEVACHSSGAQPDCGPLFERMGLPLNGSTPPASPVFRVE